MRSSGVVKRKTHVVDRVIGIITNFGPISFKKFFPGVAQKNDTPDTKISEDRNKKQPMSTTWIEHVTFRLLK